ncbi:hypothetical protein I6N90_09210 [Paenibacillus sp. GSMTC-2017]|uniref:hypothetical protein n=1 Tax=Paenibacillus sp. GSMTC-2017 TaxID=2794350 RepID=UPI0018D811C5|nr:hypothetical protein [Paenibacillus sp. GSMTC-2017]MBH5317982.1 hypothetical protein [Paenibacillus sp. GSMTC-2017]
MFRQFVRKYSDREQLMKFTESATRILRNVVIILLLLAFLSQIALQNDTIRNWLTSADRWEGTRLN